MLNKITNPALKKTWKKFCRKPDGNVAITTAITLPLGLMIGFGAIDYGAVVQAEQELQAAASAAALAGVNEAEIAFSSRQDIDLSKLVEDTTRNFFESRTAQLRNVNVSSVSIAPVVKNNVFSVDIIYSANVKSVAGEIVGVDQFNLTSRARAKTSVLSYVNFNFLFDVSASMGVGATHDDMVIMKNSIGCAFSCHLGRARGTSTYDRAKAAGASMRIDVARQAAEDAIDVMIDNTQVDEHLTASLNIYDNIFTSELKHDDPKASDLQYVKSKVQDAVQMRMEYGGSNTEHAINSLVATLPESGMGRTKDDRIQYIVVLTDGVENPQHWRPGKGWKAHSDAKINSPFKKFASHEYEYAPGTGSCKTAADKGIEVFFINAEYLVPEWKQSGHNTKRFDFIENTLHDLIPQRMAECAGNPDNVINATSPEEIKNSIKEIVGNLSTPLRLY